MLAASEDRGLDGSTDEQLLTLAASENRVSFTFDVKDFARVTREWAEAGKRHAGCAMLVGIDHSQFGAIVRAIEYALAARPAVKDWADVTIFVSRPTEV